MKHCKFDCIEKRTGFFFVTMKATILILMVAVCISNAFPLEEDVKPKVEVIRSEYVNNGDKGYNFE